MAPEGAMAVVGGNWRIFHNMVTKSKATVSMNTSVTSISLDKDDNSRPKYTLGITSSNPGAVDDGAYPVSFDKVVIATPHQFSNIDVGDDIFEQPIDNIPYVQLHVTIFSSSLKLSHTFFDLTPDRIVPSTILTTLADDDDADSGEQGAGKAGFYSISTLGKVYNPIREADEYLYKIFSPQKVTPEFLRYYMRL
jgi:prenylcysteine oxidase/farnesylcysteine lyase